MTGLRAWVRPQNLFWIIRFILIGATASIFYVVVAATLHIYLQFSEYISSIIAYLVAIPVSFFGHKKITFRDRNRWESQFFRFFILQILNISIVLLAVYVMRPYGRVGYLMGLFLGVVLMPITSLLAMRFFIFLADHRRSPERPHYDESSID